MADNKTNTGIWLGLGVLLLGGSVFIYFKNKAKKDTQNENKALDDITQSDTTSQAALLKKYLGVVELPVVGFTANPATSNQYGCINVFNAITDYPAVQKKFSELCENKYTLQRALETGLTDADYNNCIELAKRQKVITTEATKVYILQDANSETSSQYKNVAANVILGSLFKSYYYAIDQGSITTLVSAYMFFNGFDAKNKPVWAFVEKNHSRLLDVK